MCVTCLSRMHTKHNIWFSENNKEALCNLAQRYWYDNDTDDSITQEHYTDQALDSKEKAICLRKSSTHTLYTHLNGLAWLTDIIKQVTNSWTGHKGGQCNAVCSVCLSSCTHTCMWRKGCLWRTRAVWYYATEHQKQSGKTGVEREKCRT